MYWSLGERVVRGEADVVDGDMPLQPTEGKREGQGHESAPQ